jgi:hypothetical protein
MQLNLRPEGETSRASMKMAPPTEMTRDLWTRRDFIRTASAGVAAEMIERCHRRHIAVVLYASLIHDRWAFDNHPEWRGKHARGFEFGTNSRYGKPAASVEHQSSTYPLGWSNGVSYPLVPQNDFLQGDFYGDALQGSFVRKLLSELTPNRPFGYETSFSTELRDHTGKKSEALLEAKASAAIADCAAFIFIDAIDQLARFKVLILSNVHHLSPDEARAIREFVRQGGGVYASGGTSLVTTSGRRLPDFQLADVFGVSLVKADWSDREHYVAPTPAGAADFAGWEATHSPFLKGYGFEVRALPGAEVLATTRLPWPAPEPSRFSSIHSNPPWVPTGNPETVFNRFGAGRVIYCASELEEVEGLQDTFIRLLRRLQPSFTFEATAPAAVELTLFHQPDRRRYLLSMVNFQHDLPNIPVDDIQVQLRLPHGVRSMRQLVVGKAMRHRERNGVVTFTTPRLHSLALFAVNHAWSLGQPRCEGAESRTRRASGSSPARSTPRR